VERCLREIAAIEAELLAGNPNVEGLCLALSDWWMEVRLIGLEQQKPPDKCPTAHNTRADQSSMEWLR
jgi:hypothetical protein